MKLILILLLFITFDSVAKVTVIENVKYYKVAPSAKSNLLASLNKASPIREGSNIFHGHTKYNIDWRFWWQTKNKQCRFTQVKVTVKLLYTMPKLSIEEKEVVETWSSWYPNLDIHEKGHGQLAKEFAVKIDKALATMKPRENCNTLESDGNKKAYRLMDELKEANKQYDARTNHGESQNAWLYTHL